MANPNLGYPIPEDCEPRVFCYGLSNSGSGPQLLRNPAATTGTGGAPSSDVQGALITYTHLLGDQNLSGAPDYVSINNNAAVEAISANAATSGITSTEYGPLTHAVGLLIGIHRTTISGAGFYLNVYSNLTPYSAPSQAVVTLLLTSQVFTDTGDSTLQVFPGAPEIPNISTNMSVCNSFYVETIHLDSTALTYSVTAGLLT